MGEEEQPHLLTLKTIKLKTKQTNTPQNKPPQKTTIILLVFFTEDMHKLFFHFPKKRKFKFQVERTDNFCIEWK